MKEKIITARAWKYSTICKFILHSFPKLDILAALFNSKMHLLVNEHGKIVSFLRILHKKDVDELGVLFTPPKYRKNGYAKQIISYVLNHTEKPVVILGNSKYVGFWQKLGFKKTNKSTCWRMNLKKNSFNIFCTPFMGYKMVVMKNEIQ